MSDTKSSTEAKSKGFLPSLLVRLLGFLLEPNARTHYCLL